MDYQRPIPAVSEKAEAKREKSERADFEKGKKYFLIKQFLISCLVVLGMLLIHSSLAGKLPTLSEVAKIWWAIPLFIMIELLQWRRVKKKYGKKNASSKGLD